MAKADLLPAVNALWQKNRPAYLMGALFLLLLVFPAAEGRSFRGVVLSGLFSLVLLSAALSVSHSRRMLVAVLCVGVPGLALSWLGRLVDVGDVRRVVTLLSSLLLVACWLSVTVMMMADILATSRVTPNTLCRAVSAYLLLGVAWAGIYQILARLDPDAIRPLGPETNWGEFVYFSFTSLTTLGYGDITPVSAFAKSLVIVESVVGPMYLAILVARLVGLYLRSKPDDSPKET